MCIAYFKMNKLEKNPTKYMKEKCAFLFSRGYKLETYHKNGEYCFHFYLKDKQYKNKDNCYYLDYHYIDFLFENDSVDCQYSNINASGNIRKLNIDFPEKFNSFTNMEKMDCLIELVKNNIDLIDIRPLTKLQQALNLSKEGKHTEAYQIYEELYNKQNNATNSFNLLMCAVHFGKNEVEKKLYKKLQNYTPNLKKEPMELSGCFVRYYYGLTLCEAKRNQEAIEIVDYLIDAISHYKITDPTFLYIRGIPTAQMVYELIKHTFVDDKIQFAEYKNKLVSLLDEDTKKYEFKE